MTQADCFPSKQTARSDILTPEQALAQLKQNEVACKLPQAGTVACLVGPLQTVAFFLPADGEAVA